MYAWYELSKYLLSKGSHPDATRSSRELPRSRPGL
jgi:hypothetical protein